jgi:hypothetical protein
MLNLNSSSNLVPASPCTLFVHSVAFEIFFMSLNSDSYSFFLTFSCVLWHFLFTLW